MSKIELPPDTVLAPVPVVMVTCGDMEKSNIISIAWTGIICSNPATVYVSIRPERYSYNIIKETKEFVINLPNEKLVFETDYCGTKTGKNVNKFDELKLTKIKSNKLKTPIINECPINIECKLKEIKKIGTHDMFIAEIVSLNANEEIINKEGKINFDKENLLSYMGGHYYIANKQIGKRGICLL